MKKKVIHNIKPRSLKMGKAYKPAFVEKILQGMEDIKNGKGVKIELENLWK